MPEAMMRTAAFGAATPVAPAPSMGTFPAPAAAVPGSMRKVVALIAVAVVIFLASAVYSVEIELGGRRELAAIKDSYFPLLERLDANIVRIDKIQEFYVDAVTTGDRDFIAKADELGATTDQVFGEIDALSPGNGQSLAALRADLKTYQARATQVSLAFLDHATTDMTPLTAGMNAAHAGMKSRLSALRASSYQGFVGTLDASQHSATLGLYMGVLLGVMNLGFMAVLVHFIRNNLNMMRVIAEQNATLEQRVADRTAELSRKTSDINAMLQNMELGLSTVVPGGRIHPEYSDHLRKIFRSEELAGRDVMEALFAHSNLGVDVKDQIATALGAILGEDPMMFDFNAHLLVREMCLDFEGEARKIVQLGWSPILGEAGTVDKVLLITQDVTELRALESSAAAQQEELDVIARIIRISAGKFNEFAASTGQFIAESRRLLDLSHAREPDVVDALFRNMHTIKGNARTFEFTHVTDAAHAAEQSYDELRRNAAAAWNPLELARELDGVERALARYVTINEEKLGRKGRGAELMTERGAFVSNEQLAELKSLSATLEMAPAADVGGLRRAIERLGSIELNRLVSGSVDSLASLAVELNKLPPTIDVVNGTCSFAPRFAETLKNCFAHLLRNSLDHGIETPQDRRRAGKPERGTIRFACVTSAGQRVLEIGDDGQGLALHALRERGVAAGSFSTNSPSPQQIADTIFNPGVSTAADVTHVSGRGVGMDAVRTFLEQSGASIHIELQTARADVAGRVPFKFVIGLPGCATAGLAAA